MTETTTSETTSAQAATMFGDASVTLSRPIERGEQKIGIVGVRRPGAPEMRGLSLYDLVKMECTALVVLLPRITVPPLTAAEVALLPAPDLFAFGTEVSDFLLGMGPNPASPQA